MIVAPIAASDLVRMEGISNQELFAWNLRYDLRETPVNVAIEESIGNAAEHKFFPAFHNGLTVLCETLDHRRKRIDIAGYAVVNGCQSLSALFKNQAKVSPDLRILTKFIQVSPKSDLALKITDHTNNQNAITGRDRQSNNPLHTRVQTEIHAHYAGEFFYRIGRGEHTEWDAKKVIENDKMARILLAFDVKKPESCHQKFRLFDDLHAEIFGRPAVNADRIVALYLIDQTISRLRTVMSDRPFAYYTLSRYLLHYLLREALEEDETGLRFCKDPREFLDVADGRERLKHAIEPIITALMRVLDAYLKQQSEKKTGFDYKKDLKSPNKIADIKAFVISNYQMALDSKFTRSFSEEWQHSEGVFAVLANPGDAL